MWLEQGDWFGCSLVPTQGSKPDSSIKAESALCHPWGTATTIIHRGLGFSSYHTPCSLDTRFISRSSVVNVSLNLQSCSGSNLILPCWSQCFLQRSFLLFRPCFHASTVLMLIVLVFGTCCTAQAPQHPYGTYRAKSFWISQQVSFCTCRQVSWKTWSLSGTSSPLKTFIWTSALSRPILLWDFKGVVPLSPELTSGHHWLCRQLPQRFPGVLFLLFCFPV